MLRYLLVALVASAIAAGPLQQAWAQSSDSQSSQAAAGSATEYLIAPGDRLDISVLEDPTLNHQVLVRPDGKISMPLAGTMDAAGRTPEQVQAVVRSRLAKQFVTPPNVTVALAGVGSSTAQDLALLPAFFVIGQVNKPGRYNFETDKPVSVLQALAMAGGLGVFAATQRIQVRHSAGGSDAMQLFDYDAIESGDAAGPPMIIKDGDVIVVPERGLFN